MPRPSQSVCGVELDVAKTVVSKFSMMVEVIVAA